VSIRDAIPWFDLDTAKKLFRMDGTVNVVGSMNTKTTGGGDGREEEAKNVT